MALLLAGLLAAIASLAFPSLSRGGAQRDADSAPAVRAARRPSDAYRAQHARFRNATQGIERLAEGLPAAPPEDRRVRMAAVTETLTQAILPEMEWETRTIYPAVDRRAGANGCRMTATLRYEHLVALRWADELERAAAEPDPDAAAFARLAERLLGLLLAHQEVEEEVLLPLLDITMTTAEFDREVMRKEGGPPIARWGRAREVPNGTR